MKKIKVRTSDNTERALVESLAKEGVGDSRALQGSIDGKVNALSQDDVKSIELHYFSMEVLWIWGRPKSPEWGI